MNYSGPLYKPFLSPTAFIDSHGTAGYVQYGVDLDILLNKLISAELNNSAALPGPSNSSAPQVANTQAPPEEAKPAESAQEGQTLPAAITSSKLRYYVPFFEILALLFGILFLNLFVFAYLRNISGAVGQLESHVSNSPRRGKFSHELEQLFVQELRFDF